MSAARPNFDDEVDQLLLNARLRDELEPYRDESFEVIDSGRIPTRTENEYLASMLAWERAPVLPISRWFQPELTLPRPDRLSPQELQDRLWTTIYALYDQRIVLEFTEHLSDLELYCLIIRDILPSLEKKLERDRSFLHWQCIDPNADPELWLRYYATDEEREGWLEEAGEDETLPPSEPAPYPRKLPRATI